MPCSSTSAKSDSPSLTKPLVPTPAGTRSNSASTSSRMRGRTSSSVRSVSASRMPQLMSKPIPPGEMTPVSTSIAATPPIGKP